MSRQTFLAKFDNDYAPLLEQRANTFRAVFAVLRQRPRIVETGTTHVRGYWSGHGCSTLLFDQYVQHCGGKLWTVDVNTLGKEVSDPLVSAATTFVIMDSVAFLMNVGWGIDLLYLDSLEGPGAPEHQLAEFQAARPHLNPGAIVFIDDISFKGALLIPVMDKAALRLTTGNIQMAWRMPDD